MKFILLFIFGFNVLSSNIPSNYCGPFLGKVAQRQSDTVYLPNLTYFKRLQVPDSAEAKTLRAKQNFNRIPQYPNTPIFIERSRKANELFNDWLSAPPKDKKSLDKLMIEMNLIYLGADSKLAGYYREGNSSTTRYEKMKAFIKLFPELEVLPNGFVLLPNIPKEMSPYFGYEGGKYLYPAPHVTESILYHNRMEVLIVKYSTYLAELQKLPKSNEAELKIFRAKEREIFDVIVDFGRIAAAFRQFENGNWGLYGPMINSLLNRMGYEIKHPGYLDIIFQSATEKSLKPWFEKSIREGKDFYIRGEKDIFKDIIIE